MVSCLLIFGEPHNGKTTTMIELSKIFCCKAYSFDFFISFIAEFVRLSQENRLKEINQKKFFPSPYFKNSNDFELFIADIANLLSKNSDFFKSLYKSTIKDTIPNSEYDPKLHNLKNVINLGLIGDKIEGFAEEIISSIFNHLVKDSPFFIIEGFSFNQGKKYRVIIEKLCDKITYLESFYNKTAKLSHYKVNNSKSITVKPIEETNLIRKPKKKYQSFSENEIGDSHSFIKINQLGIPENLEGKNVLDLGCNEGFYCFECEKRGAFAVGIEKNKIWYSLALERKQEFSSSAIFMNTDWNEVPKIPYRFDLVLFLAAFHYALNIQLTLLKKIYSKMNKNGLLILEVGLSESNEKNFFIEEYVRPSGEICQYPNKFSMEHLLKDAGFSRIEFMGDGYKMKGDKFPRFIIHATK